MSDTSFQLQRFDGTEDVIKSAFRTLTLFEFFADIQRDASISEMMKALKIPQSSLSVLVRFCTDMGYLAYNPDSRTYYPTLRFQYILVEHGGAIMRDHVETGSLRPLVCSASGWSLLANEPDNEIEKLIRKTQVLIQNETWKSTAPQAVSHINFVRENGYAYSKGEATNGASGLAMSIPTLEHIPRLSIAVAGPHDEISEKKDAIITAMKGLVSKLPASITQDILTLPLPPNT